MLYGGQALLFLSVIITGLQGRTMQAPATDIAGGERVIQGDAQRGFLTDPPHARRVQVSSGIDSRTYPRLSARTRGA